MTISLDEAHYAKAMAGGIPYTAGVPVTRSAAHCRVVVYDYDGDLLGGTSVSVR